MRTLMRRVLLWLLALPLGVVLGVSVYAMLVHVGVAPSPFAPVAGDELALARSGRPGLRVLFVGNSLTFKNDLPELVYRLSGPPRPVFAASFTAPGWTLHGAAESTRLADLLREVPWDVVVLQEQSQIPSFPAGDRAREFDPYVERLDQEIRASGARTLLFETWAHRSGDRANVHDDTYAAMQLRLIDGYSDAAAHIRARIAPVGLAWSEALRRRPGLQLWAWDGRHPSRLGSYLAACVFYATLTRKSPVGNRFTDGLREAPFLQRVAWDTARFRY
jgi:hypothetical protein